MGYKGLQGVTRGYKNLKGVRGGYKALPELIMITGSFKGLQGVKRD